ncbi:MAG: hypothetical protein AAF585_04815 [Verrucomicrobiota bacterium]
MLTAILMQPEVLFRQELSEDKRDPYGRIRLTRREIHSAFSDALDNKQ